jgi:hypothetical protein
VQPPKHYTGVSQMPQAVRDQLAQAMVNSLNEAAAERQAEQESKIPSQPLQTPKYYARGSHMPQAEFDALAQDMASRWCTA